MTELVRSDPASVQASDRDLGLDCPITRRDFLNATLLGAGAALLGARAPIHLQAAAPSGAAWTGYGGVGDYAASNGNTWEVMQVAHDLRDGKFTSRLADAVDTGETYDLIVVGGGMSGLGAAHYFQQQRRGTCLILDNHPIWGGEAKRNEFLVDGIRLIGPQGSNQGSQPADGWARALWQDLGLPAGEDR